MRMEDLYGTSSAVLIVPLWNWNLEQSSLASSSMSFNRTFMELKLVSLGLIKFYC